MKPTMEFPFAVVANLHMEFIERIEFSSALFKPVAIAKRDDPFAC